RRVDHVSAAVARPCESPPDGPRGTSRPAPPSIARTSPSTPWPRSPPPPAWERPQKTPEPSLPHDSASVRQPPRCRDPASRSFAWPCVNRNLSSASRPPSTRVCEGGHRTVYAGRREADVVIASLRCGAWPRNSIAGWNVRLLGASGSIERRPTRVMRRAPLAGWLSVARRLSRCAESELLQKYLRLRRRGDSGSSSDHTLRRHVLAVCSFESIFVRTQHATRYVNTCKHALRPRVRQLFCGQRGIGCGLSRSTYWPCRD